ncbi:hypothetical protein [Paenibacillus glucanolyticus]|uniref:hypothetical protein n=1 Tax=Paenibacillus glucanolyticus TaxID=59843 RepID=UPI0034CEACCA
MLSHNKLNVYVVAATNDTNAELDQFLQDLLVLIEFGQFDDEVTLHISKEQLVDHLNQSIEEVAGLRPFVSTLLIKIQNNEFEPEDENYTLDYSEEW